MAIGAITVGTGAGAAPSAPTFVDVVSFAGDGDYPTGGTAAFEDAYQTKVGCARTIVAIMPLLCGGYTPVYDRANDKLKVYYCDNNAVADGPLIQCPAHTDLSGVTFRLAVFSQ